MCSIYSYSYDITHTLQYNMAPCKVPDNMASGTSNLSEEEIKFWNKERSDSKILLSPSENDIEDANKSFRNFLDADQTEFPNSQGIEKDDVLKGDINELNYATAKVVISFTFQASPHTWVRV